MTAPAETVKDQASSRPAIERVLRHLSREHALVLLCDEQEHIAWVSDPHRSRFELFCGSWGPEIAPPGGKDAQWTGK